MSKFFKVVTSSVYFRQEFLFIISYTHATYLAHLILPYFTILEISADEYKLWNLILRISPQATVRQLLFV